MLWQGTDVLCRTGLHSLRREALGAHQVIADNVYDGEGREESKPQRTRYQTD